MELYELRGAYETEDGCYIILTDTDTSDAEKLYEVAQECDTIEELALYVKNNRDAFASCVYIYKASWEALT